MSTAWQRAWPPGATHVVTLLLLAAAVTAAVGCDSVGQGLVDHQPLGTGSRTGALCGDPPAKCTLAAALPIAKLEPRAAQPVDLSSCGSERQPCASSGAGSAACLSWKLGGSTPEPRTLPSCAELHIRSAAPNQPSSTRLTGLVLEHDNLFIEAESPLELELDGASLRDVYIALRGPVQLRLVNTESFSTVTLEGAAPETQAARVELERVIGSDFVLGSGQASFAGSVALLRSVLTRSQLDAHDVSMQSAQWDESLVNTTTLVLTDVKMSIGELAFDSAVISASRLKAVQVDSCASLTLIATDTTDMHVPGCTQQPTRIYGGLISGGLFEGSLESDSAAWDSPLLGVREATQLVTWGGSLTSVGLCGSMRALRLGAGTTVSCSVCAADVLAKPGAACTIPDLYAHLEENDCKALKQPTVCKAPLPVRERP